MGEPLVISALRRKRAELAGEILTARRQIEKLRDDLDNIDRTLRVFDPAIRLEKIRPVVRRKGASFFHHGECGRAIMDTLRRSGEPLSAQEIADRLEEMFVNRGCDGFVIAATYVPGSYADFVKHIVPELQRRGLYHNDYTGTTLRENLGLRRPAAGAWKIPPQVAAE